jgi:TolB-like protein/tetratricopeptide (TPR) repeat protein
VATVPQLTPDGRVDARDVREHLDKVLASSSFTGAPRVQQFLRFVVEEALEGRAGEIKESVVAVQVFGRRSDFDSHSDSVVRVQATHLRKRLREYYRIEGLRDGVVIDLPPGAYVPAFRAAAGSPVPVAGPRRRRWLLPLAVLSVLAATLALGTFAWLARVAPTSIAVLPFVSLDGASESDYLVEGIAEDLMTSLARSPDLRVVARTSAFQFRGKNISAQSVGRDLGASVLLEGSIRGEPKHLKIAAQLVNVASGFDLWSESWEGPAGDAPLFEEQIVRAVERQVLGNTPGKREPTVSATAVRPPLPGAQEAYWRGRYLLSKGHETRSSSIQYLEAAAQADPQYAPAYAALTTAYSTMAFHMEGDVGELVAKARAAGGRALQLDPGSAETLGSLAVLSYAFDHDWPAAERGFERALELNPSYARGHLQYALGLVTRARFDAAIAHIRAARGLDPLSYSIGNDLALALECAGRYDESIASARQTLRNDPQFAYAHVPLGAALSMKGDNPAAIAELEQAIQSLGRGPWILGSMGFALARAGRRVEAASIAKEIESVDGPGVQLAYVYAALGDKARALDALERAYGQRLVDLNFMAVDPMLASLRGEPRFLALKSRMGL